MAQDTANHEISPSRVVHPELEPASTAHIIATQIGRCSVLNYEHAREHEAADAESIKFIGSHKHSLQSLTHPLVSITGSEMRDRAHHRLPHATFIDAVEIYTSEPEEVGTSIAHSLKIIDARIAKYSSDNGKNEEATEEQTLKELSLRERKVSAQQILNDIQHVSEHLSDRADLELDPSKIIPLSEQMRAVVALGLEMTVLGVGEEVRNKHLLHIGNEGETQLFIDLLDGYSVYALGYNAVMHSK